MSVKTKLLALYGCILAGFVLVFAIDFLKGRLTEHTLELERLSVRAQLEVLQMRRQEKNYFLRQDPTYLSAVDRHQKAACRVIEGIRALDPDRDPACDAALRLLGAYLAGFTAMTGNADMAATEDAYSPAAVFLDRSQALERLAGSATGQALGPALGPALGKLRLLEKRWLASGSPESLSRLQDELGRLLARTRQDEAAADAAEALAAYAAALRAYADRLSATQSTEVGFIKAARELEPMMEDLRQHYGAKRRDIAATASMAAAATQAAVLVLVALAALAVFRGVATPLASLRRHARRVARGEDTNLDPAAFSGEFRDLAEDIGRMEKHLLATILDLARKEREAAQEARMAREARQRAEDLSRVKSNFLSLVSHELKTPLTSMVGFAQVMLKRLEKGVFFDLAAERPQLAPEFARFRENLDIMLSEGRRLTELINNVLELAALESGDAALPMEAVSVTEALDQAATPFLEAIAAKGLEFRRDIPRDMPPLRCDRERIVYVLRHLLSNAVKFTDAGHIVCRARQEGDLAVISIEDTGPGIAPHMREAVFEKFLQLGDNVTGKMPGLGIGLAASRAVVEHHGGEIHIAGEPGRGSTVTISLPLAEAA